MNNNEIIARWRYGPNVVMIPRYDYDSLGWWWYGSGGLLQKIKEKGLLQRFADELIREAGIVVAVEHDGSMWLPVESVPDLVKASGDPAQLSAALVAMIKGGTDDTR